MSRFAYVTLVTNNDYAAAALALVRSLVLSRTQASIVVMHTGGVDPQSLKPVADLGGRLHQVNLLDTSDAFNSRHTRDQQHKHAPFTKGNKPSFHTPLDNFAKLRLWQLADFERVVFLDADTLVLRNIDRLFGYPEFSAAPNVYQSLEDFQRLNSGVFVAKPSLQTFDAMMAHLDKPDVFWRRDGPDIPAGFFQDWHGLPIFDNLLQYVWFNMPALWDWGSVRVIHYQYEKPWQQDHPKAEQLKPLIALWHAYHSGHDIPDIDQLPAPDPC